MLRHAKSDWSADTGEDLERPLAPRGRHAARLVGRYLTAIDRVPDLVVCSPAARARSTIELAAQAGDWSAPVEFTGELYGNGPAAVLEVVRRQDARHKTLLLAGHEPTWSELVGRLIGGATVRFPTAALASIRFQAETWSEVRDGSGVLELLITPKTLPSRESSER